MTDELLCPFCGKPLLACIYNQNDIIYCCDNQDCVYHDDADNQNAKHYLATPEFWEALIDTKKKLDIAVDAINHIKKNCMTMIETEGVCGKVIEQIKDKEQQ